MNPQLFLDNFRHLANAPNGLDKLRELVLCLAMQGKLSERIKSDSSVDDLLETVKREKQELIEEGLLRGLIQPIPVRPEEMSHPIPKEWRWARFGHIAEHNAGKTLDQRRNTGIPRDYITTSNLYWGRFDLRQLRQMLIRDEELERCTARKGDLLICEGGEAGRAAVWPYDREVSFQNHVHRARFYASINPYFVFRFLQKMNATGEINHYRKGVGISNMSGKSLASIPLPVPPLEEQERIVAKVNELMALCDKIETQQHERERRFPLLSRTCHIRLAGDPAPANLNRIFKETGAVSPDDLRRTILTLAAQGQLVAQDSNDEPANACLTRLGITSTFKPEGLERALPPSWCYVRFEDVAMIAGGVTLGRKLGDRRMVTLPYLRVANVKRGEIDLSVVKEVSIAENEIERYTLRENDLLMTEGGDWDKVGRAAIWKGQIPVCLHQNHIFRARFRSAEILPIWFERYFNSPLGRSYFESASKQTTNLASINMRQVRGCPIPFPPLVEQHRIVAKVDELMLLVNHLEAQHQERDKLAQVFVKACVASFTGTAQLERHEKMKAPKTELVSNVALGKKPKTDAKAPLAKLLSQHKGTLPAKSLWQQSGLTIDAFYQQLKVEIAQGWIVPPAEAQMKTVEEL